MTDTLPSSQTKDGYIKSVRTFKPFMFLCPRSSGSLAILQGVRRLSTPPCTLYQPLSIGSHIISIRIRFQSNYCRKHNIRWGQRKGLCCCSVTEESARMVTPSSPAADLTNKILGQANRPILRVTCLQDIPVGRLCYDRVNSRCSCLR